MMMMVMMLSALAVAKDATGTGAGTGPMVSTATAAATVRGRHVALHRRVELSIHRQLFGLHSSMSNQDHACGAISLLDVKLSSFLCPFSKGTTKFLFKQIVC